jgi:hypothetical protein
MKMNLDITNYVTYKHAKFYHKILILCVHKITKSDTICNFKICILKSKYLSFCVAKKTKYLNMIFFQDCGINSWLHVFS